MDRNSPHIQLAYHSIACFSDDGTLDLEEINFLMGIALADKNIDDDERRVLSSIFSKISMADVAPKVWDRIKAIKEKHSIP